MKIIKIIILIHAILYLLLVSLVSGNCKQYGCPHNERCMADGICTPLYIEEYCEMNEFYRALIEKINCSKEKPIEREKLCMQCVGHYKVKKLLADLTNTLYIIAIGISSIFLAINGLKFITSSSSEERKDIKKAIVYVLLGLIFIFMASKLVEYLYLI